MIVFRTRQTLASLRSEMGAVGVDNERHVEADQEVEFTAVARVRPEDIAAVIAREFLEVPAVAQDRIWSRIVRQALDCLARIARDCSGAVENCTRDRAPHQVRRDWCVGYQRDVGGAGAQTVLKLIELSTIQRDMATKALCPARQPCRGGCTGREPTASMVKLSRSPERTTGLGRWSVTDMLSAISSAASVRSTRGSRLGFSGRGSSCVGVIRTRFVHERGGA